MKASPPIQSVVSPLQGKMVEVGGRMMWVSEVGNMIDVGGKTIEIDEVDVLHGVATGRCQRCFRWYRF